jgi:hypothetical protein
LIGSVAHQPAGCDKFTIRISRWNPVARRQGDNLHAAAREVCVGCDEEGIGALARKAGKGRIDLAHRSGVVDLDLQPECLPSRNAQQAVGALLSRGHPEVVRR